MQAVPKIGQAWERPSNPVLAAFPATVPAFRLDLPSLVVGPALLPVSANLVSLIVSGQFVNLDSLVGDPNDNDTPAFSSLDDKIGASSSQGTERDHLY